MYSFRVRLCSHKFIMKKTFGCNNSAFQQELGDSVLSIQQAFKVTWWQLNHCPVKVNFIIDPPQTLVLSFFSPNSLFHTLDLTAFFVCFLSSSPSSPLYSQASLTFTWSACVFPGFSMLSRACRSERLYGPHPSASHARIYGWWSPNLTALNQSCWSWPLGRCGL